MTQPLFMSKKKQNRKIRKKKESKQSDLKSFKTVNMNGIANEHRATTTTNSESNKNSAEHIGRVSSLVNWHASEKKEEKILKWTDN